MVDSRKVHSDRPQPRRWRFLLSERWAYFIFTFVLTLGTVWFTSFVENFAFGWREVIIGSVAGLVLGCIVAIASDWLRELIFWLLFP
jgi:hypothetical protein